MKRLVTSLSSSLLTSRSTRRIINDFTEYSGLVYFGFVSQSSDEHQLVRGLTVSTKHRDDHYCIGTFDGYDVMFVERSDTLQSGKRHSWHVMAFDLKSRNDIPHTFISSKKRTKGFHELLSIKYRTMLPLAIGATTRYPTEFTDYFEVYAAPSDILDVESLITPDIAKTIAKHCKGLVFEIHDNYLYVYSEQMTVSVELLHTMLENGRWLAGQLDMKNQQPIAAGNNSL